MQNIKKAETLVTSGKLDDRYKAIEIYTRTCMNFSLCTEELLAAIKSFYHHASEDANDVLYRWRDAIPYCQQEAREKMIGILVTLTRTPEVKSIERLLTTTMLFNRGYIEVCYDCFSDIACDSTVLIDHRVEACRYLVASENTTHKELAQECLMEFIKNLEYPSNYRYKIIAGYTNRKGITTNLNMSKLRIAYDEGFVLFLQEAFFKEIKNGMRERILSGQFILMAESVAEEEKHVVCDTLLKIACDVTLEENLRADAADVVMRLGVLDTVIRARQVITDLGYSASTRVRTVYSDKQNVHDHSISECVSKFIDRIISESSIRLRAFEDIHSEVTTFILQQRLEAKQRFKVNSALNRISIDNATFTDKRVTLAEIFSHVWTRIQQTEDASIKKTLEDRFLEELMEMDQTCSTGHAARLVNVLAEQDVSLRISWSAQVIANLAGRMNARIKTIEDEELKASVTMGMLDDASEDDVKVYRHFIETMLVELRSELEKEFVGEGYVNQRNFDEYFEEGQKQWRL